MTLTGTTDSTSTSTGILVISGGLGVAKSFYMNGTFSNNGNFTVSSAGLVTAKSNIVFSGAGLGVLQSTADGSDNTYVHVSGGGGEGDTRGAYIQVHGNERAATGGKLELGAGDSATAGYITFLTLGAEVARFDRSTTATHTRFMVYDVDNATVERVTVGAADSGGSGFKVLRIPN